MSEGYIFDESNEEEYFINDIDQVDDLSRSTLTNLYNGFKREKNSQLRDYIVENRPDIMCVLELNEENIYQKSKKEIMYDIAQRVKYTSENSAYGIAKISEVFFHAIIISFAATLFNIVTKNGERIKSTLNVVSSGNLKDSNKQVFSLDKKYMLKELDTIESTLNKFINSFINKKLTVRNKKEYISFVNKISSTIRPLENIIGFDVVRLENDVYKIFKDTEMINKNYIQKKSSIFSFKFNKDTDVISVLKKLERMQDSMDNKHMKMLEDIETIISSTVDNVIELRNKDEVFYNKQAIRFQFNTFRILIKGKSNSMKKISNALDNVVDKDRINDKPLVRAPIKVVK